MHPFLMGSVFICFHHVATSSPFVNGVWHSWTLPFADVAFSNLNIILSPQSYFQITSYLFQVKVRRCYGKWEESGSQLDTRHSTNLAEIKTKIKDCKAIEYQCQCRLCRNIFPQLCFFHSLATLSNNLLWISWLLLAISCNLDLLMCSYSILLWWWLQLGACVCV